MRLIFLRHGKTIYNEQGITQGWCDSPLSAIGKQQALQTHEYLKDMDINRVYCSPSGRTKETLRIVLDRDIPVIYDERLKEIHFGIFEEQLESIRMDKEIESPLWYQDLDMDYRLYGGECLKDVIQRMQSLIDDCVEYQDETILICSHGCAITGFIQSLCHQNLPCIQNAGVIIISYNGNYQIETIFEPIIND